MELVKKILISFLSLLMFVTIGTVNTNNVFAEDELGSCDHTYPGTMDEEYGQVPIYEDGANEEVDEPIKYEFKCSVCNETYQIDAENFYGGLQNEMTTTETNHEGYTVLPKTSGYLGSGKYYLNADLEGNGEDHLWINENSEVTICLCGHTLDLKGKLILLRPGSSLTIDDCSGDNTGRIISNNTDASNAVIRTYGDNNSGAITRFTLNNGTIEAIEGSKCNGINYNSNVIFIVNINGGKIISTNGVGIKTAAGNAGSQLNINGGEIISLSSNTKAMYSSGIYCEKVNVITNISGGSISGGLYGIYVAGSAGKVSLSGGTFHGTTNAIGSGSQTLSKMLLITDQYESKYFADESSTEPITFSGCTTTNYTDITIKRTDIAEGVHVCDGTQYDNILTAETTTLENDKNYYLSEDIETSGNIQVNGNVKLCLNGHTLNLKGYQFQLENNASLEIYDCKNGAGIIADGTAISFQGNAALALNSGKISNTTDNPLITSSGNYKCVINIKDGTIASVGSAISIPNGNASSNSSVSISGGTISSSSNSTISLTDTDASLTITGGSISSTNANAIVSAGTVSITKGTINGKNKWHFNIGK